MLTAVENAEELQVLVGELSKLESLAKVEQEKIEQDKEVKQLRQEQEILKNKNIHTRTVEKQGEENGSAESTNHSKPFRRPSRPPPAVPISQTARRRNQRRQSRGKSFWDCKSSPIRRLRNGNRFYVRPV